MTDTAETILRSYSRIAVVGLSRDPSKAAHAIPATLRAAGFRIIPVNPHTSTLLGERVYGKLADIQEPVDVVLAFRPATEAVSIARQAVDIGAKALWLQLGIRSDEARQIAEGAGLAFVEDRCIAVERAIHRIDKRDA